jgi:hypothetical protein
MCGHATLADIPAVVERITSPMITRIKLSFRCQEKLEKGLWRAIPAILRPNFRQLRKLEFRIWESADIKRWIRTELLELELRGITVVVRFY